VADPIVEQETLQRLVPAAELLLAALEEAVEESP
jgi:hypothetical protein